MKTGFMFGYDDFYITDFNDEANIERYLKDNKILSINMNDYYIFVLKAIDTTDERYSRSLLSLNNQILQLLEKEK